MDEYKSGFEKNKKKEGFVDKRRFKRKINKEESLEIHLISELTLFEVQDISNVVKILKDVNNFCHLNFRLLILVYLYFSRLKFDIALVISNFDNDFNEILKDVKKKGLFPKVEGELKTYKFRQDFIMYLILLYNQYTGPIGSTDIVENEDEGEDEEDIEENEYRG